MRNLLAKDLRALFLILFVAVILALVAKSVVGGAGGFILGWAALIFASALAALHHRLHHLQPVLPRCAQRGRGGIGVRVVRRLDSRGGDGHSQDRRLLNPAVTNATLTVAFPAVRAAAPLPGSLPAVP